MDGHRRFGVTGSRLQVDSPSPTRLPSTRRYSPQSSATSGANASSGGATLTSSSSTLPSGQATISPSTASGSESDRRVTLRAARVTRQNRLTQQGHPRQLHARKLPDR